MKRSAPLSAPERKSKKAPNRCFFCGYYIFLQIPFFTYLRYIARKKPP